MQPASRSDPANPFYKRMEEWLGRPRSGKERQSFRKRVSKFVAGKIHASLLEDLANAAQEGAEYFRRGPHFEGQSCGIWRDCYGRFSDKEIMEAARQVRSLWVPDLPQTEKQAIVRGWAKTIDDFPIGALQEQTGA